MRRFLVPSIGVVSIACSAAATLWTGNRDDKPAAAATKLPDKWADLVTVKDLADEINESAGRMGQNLKKQSDFDKFLKYINAESHLTAVLAELVRVHPEAGSWKTNAMQLQEQALIVAKAAEAKGSKNFHSAQDAHKKIMDLAKKKVDAGDHADGTT